MATNGDKVYLKAKPQFFQPAGNPIVGFHRNGSVPNDSVVNDWITDNYNDCTYLGQTQEVGGKVYYSVRLNFTYRKHGLFGIGSTVKSSEDLWFLESDISFEYIQTQADIDEAEKEALRKKLLDELDKPPGGAGGSGSGDDGSGNTKSNSTVLIVAISSAVAVLGGVLWWAFGKKKGQAPAAAQPPTIIRIPNQNGVPPTERI